MRQDVRHPIHFFHDCFRKEDVIASLLSRIQQYLPFVVGQVVFFRLKRALYSFAGEMLIQDVFGVASFPLSQGKGSALRVKVVIVGADTSQS